mgnify:CR=1 FL=1
MLDDLTDQVLNLCDTIPAGKAVAYGDLAEAVGATPRQIGRIMRTHGHLTCWWRVVRADGHSAVADRAVEYWEAEGIPYDGLKVKLNECRFEW